MYLAVRLYQAAGDGGKSTGAGNLDSSVAMDEATLPYSSITAHDAAIAAAGGPEKSLSRSVELVELAFQLEALALAVDMDQPTGLVEIFRTNAHLALAAVRKP